jgi:tRNA modification GTPase
VVDGSSPLDEADRHVFREISAVRREEDGNQKPVLVVANKSDLIPGLDLEDLSRVTKGANILGISSKTGAGLKELEKQIANALLGEVSSEGEQITRLRHKNALERAFEALTHAEESFRRRESLEFVVLDLKSAIDRLRELIGEIYSEDLLDVIFSEFCIGK